MSMIAVFSGPCWRAFIPNYDRQAAVSMIAIGADVAKKWRRNSQHEPNLISADDQPLPGDAVAGSNIGVKGEKDE